MRSHQRLIHAVLTTATATVLAACGSATTPASTVEPSPSVGSRDQLFLSAVANAGVKSWTAKGPTDEELLDYPKQWCSSFDAGHDVAYTFDLEKGGMYPIGVSWDTDLADAHKVLLLAVGAYCPQHLSAVKKELGAG